jgi:long-chain acyl-CoA synthetase
MNIFKQITNRSSLSGDDELKWYQAIETTFTDDAGQIVYAGNLLATAAKKYCDDIALITPERTLTFKQLYVHSVALSKKLQKLGIKPRDRVMMFCENSIEFYIFYFAVWQIGAIVVPVNIFLHQKELAYIMADSQPSAILVQSKFKEKFDALCSENLFKTLPPILTNEPIDLDQSITQLEEDATDFSVISLQPDELCLLLYTSGTTGKPKGVMLSSRNVMSNTMQSSARLQVTTKEQERFFCVLPLFHVFAQNACMWLPLMVGSAIIIVPSIDRKQILCGLKAKPTIFFGVPALYGLLCLMKYAPLDSVKMFVSGADALPDRIRAAFGLVYGRKICAGYGLTEASPVVAVNDHEGERHTTVVGKPVAGLECDIRDDEGKSLPLDVIGTLWLRGGNIMLGYYNSSEETEKVLQDGWLNTGDIACLDYEGNLAIKGRCKDVIIHKGFNIYPQEIEHVLMKHPSVFKAAVLGREDSNAGQIPIAFVAVKQKDAQTESLLRSLCLNNLASYKIPRKFICLDDLPLSATGKVDKKQLRHHLD